MSLLGVNVAGEPGGAVDRDQYPEDLIGTAMFLSAAANDFITGQTINVDGGKAMH